MKFEFSASKEEFGSFSDSEVKENLSFAHSPYGSDSFDFDEDSHTPTSPRSAASGSSKRNCNVYISNLPAGVDDAWLRKEFGRFGLITSAKVMQAYSKKRVYAFVQYTEEHMANAAVEGANGVYVGDYPLVVKFADRDKDKGLPNQPSNNLYVSNLPTDFGVADLERIFCPYGPISSSVVLMHPQTGTGRGVGLVRYERVKDATAAIQGLNGCVLAGHDRPLEVKYAEDQETKRARKTPKKPAEKTPKPTKVQPAPPAQQGPKSTPVQQSSSAEFQQIRNILQQGEQFNPSTSVPPLQPVVSLPAPDPQASVYVGGLPRDMHMLHAYQLFAPFGALVSVDIQPDPRADTSYAYVQYRSQGDASYAVEQLDGAMLAGRRLYSFIHSPYISTVRMH